MINLVKSDKKVSIIVYDICFYVKLYQAQLMKFDAIVTS